MTYAQGHVSLTSGTKYFCYSRVRAKNCYFSDPYEVVEVVNMMEYKVNVRDVVNTYPCNMLKLYVERQNVTSYHSAVVDAVIMPNPRITEILQFIG